MKTIEDAYELLNDIARLSGHEPFISSLPGSPIHVNCSVCRDLMYSFATVYAPLLISCGQTQDTGRQLAVYRSEQYINLKSILLKEYGWEVV